MKTKRIVYKYSAVLTLVASRINQFKLRGFVDGLGERSTVGGIKEGGNSGQVAGIVFVGRMVLMLRFGIQDLAEVAISRVLRPRWSPLGPN